MASLYDYDIHEGEREAMSKHSEYPQDPGVYHAWIEVIVDEAMDELNSWETGFIESISNQLDSGKSLSQAQANKLEDIYTKHTS